MRRIFNILIILVFCFGLLGCFAEKKEKAEAPVINILWAKWAPADYLEELSKEFTEKTGIKVVVHKIPWETFHLVFFDAVNRKSNAYDLICGDSQWLGIAARDEFYINLSYFFNLHNVDEIMTKASVKGYSEYPTGSGKFWAVPLQGDAMGFAYRKDLFENPKEKKAFKEKYGYELTVPETWKHLIDIAEFFFRPEEGFYGATIWGANAYDAITMGVETFIWAWGADLGDYNTYKVKGILNTQKGQQAVMAYKRLYQTSPPGWGDAYIDTNKSFYQGKVAMIMNYYAFFPDMLDASVNPYSEKTGFFANPKGPEKRVTSLGGQGLSIVSYTKKKAESLKYLEWFIQKETQRKWADLGGFTCRKDVLNSTEFIEKASYNKQLSDSLAFMQDFWAVPEYNDLLMYSQKYLYGYIVEDKYTAKEALDNIADSWERVFELAGYYKE